MLKVVALTILICTGCTATWERAATLGVSNAVIVCDLSQTLWMAHGGKWDRNLQEADPLLMSNHPSTGTILFANLGSIALNTAAYFLLSKRWGNAVNTSVLIVEGANVTTQPRMSGCELHR